MGALWATKSLCGMQDIQQCWFTSHQWLQLTWSLLFFTPNCLRHHKKAAVSHPTDSSPSPGPKGEEKVVKTTQWKTWQMLLL